MKKIFIILSPLFILMFSCKKDKTDPVSSAKPYLNTNIGTTWIYDVITDSTSVSDTLTVINGDTSINARTYSIVNHSNGNYHSYFNLTGTDYYRFENVAALATSIDALYLKDNLDVGGTWSQTVNVELPGGIGGSSTTLPLVLNYTILEKGVSKAVNGTNYDDVVTVKTDLSSGLLPITSAIKNYYSRNIGLIESDNDIDISLAGVQVHSQTLLKRADLH